MAEGSIVKERGRGRAVADRYIREERLTSVAGVGMGNMTCLQSCVDMDESVAQVGEMSR